MTGLRCEALEDRQLLSTLVWNGTNAGNVDWSVAGNWLLNGNPAAPVAGDRLVFSNAAPAIIKSANNDFPVDTNFQIEIDTGGYSLAGNEISISGANAIRR